MKIELWGVRGSIPTPMTNREYRHRLSSVIRQAIVSGVSSDEESIREFFRSLPPHLKYVTGGNTTCVSVMSEAGNLFIIDAGTGIVELGNQILRSGSSYRPVPAGEKTTIHHLFTHTHWDHVQGLPFFKPLYIPDFSLAFLSPYPDLPERLSRQQNEDIFFPARFEETGSSKTFRTIKPGENMKLDDSLSVSCWPLAHPGGCHAYRFHDGRRTFLFATDVEFTGEDMEKSDSDRFFHGADVLIMDSQYTLEESFFKFSWGHTSITMAVNCAVRWGVKNLFLTHHEPAYDDGKIGHNLQLAREHQQALGDSALKIFLARERMKITL